MRSYLGLLVLATVSVTLLVVLRSVAMLPGGGSGGAELSASESARLRALPRPTPATAPQLAAWRPAQKAGQQQQQQQHEADSSSDASATAAPSAAAESAASGGASSESGSGSSAASSGSAAASAHPFWGGEAATLRQSPRPCLSGAYGAGEWVRDESRAKQHPYDGIGEVTGSCGRHHRRLHPGEPTRDAVLWRWQPRDCELLRWSEEAFCKGLNGRDIMTAGDSIQEMWHTSMYHALGGRKDLSKTEGTTVGRPRCPTHPICGAYYPKPLKLYHLTNQFLELRTKKNVMRSWWRYIHKYGLLVINSGAWMVVPDMPGRPVRPVSDERYLALMQQAATYLKRNYTGTVVFRTTYPGHPNCQDAQGPLQEPIPTPYPQQFARFRWEAIRGRNEAAKRIFAGIGARILDVEPMTALRADGHVGKWHPKNWEFRKNSPPVELNLTSVIDCLHYCIPGPMDTWTELLMNMLLGNLS